MVPLNLRIRSLVYQYKSTLTDIPELAREPQTVDNLKEEVFFQN